MIRIVGKSIIFGGFQNETILHKLKSIGYALGDCYLPMEKRERVTERQLKADNQMEWVTQMDDIRSRATEIVNNDLIYPLTDNDGREINTSLPSLF